MNDGVMNWWNGRSDEYFGGLRSQLNKLKADPAWAFPPVVYEMIKDALPDLKNKRVLVPSSGDNCAAFGFCLLGANVTSCDVAERQLKNAKAIADENGWDIEFIRQDCIKLGDIKDGIYDLVYTSNGVHVWISDLQSMYCGFARVLKPGGRYVMFETHPFIRPFDDSGPEIKIVKPYGETGPFVTGEITEYKWRAADLFNAISDAGFRVTRMEEFHSKPDEYDTWFTREPGETGERYAMKYDWKINPWAALPQWIGFSAIKGAAKI